MGMRDWVAKVVTGGAGVAEKGSFSRFPFMAKTQEASRKRWGERRRLTVEPLEPRLLLNATLAVGDFTLMDDGALSPGSAAGSVALATGTTGGVTANVTTDANDTHATGIQVVLPGSTPATFTIDLSMSGTSGASPAVTFSNLLSGDIINLNLYNETVNFTANHAAVTGATTGYTAATYVADSNFNLGTGTLVGGGGSFAAAGDIGGTTMGATLAGGDINIFNENTSGNVGLLTISSVDLTLAGATNLNIDSEATGTATTDGGVTVTGTTNLGGTGNNSMTVTTVAGTGAGSAGAQVSLLGDITLGAGNAVTYLEIASPDFSSSNLGNVTLGNLTTEGSGGAGGFGSFMVYIGTGFFSSGKVGAVSIGDINISGTNGSNGVQIGHYSFPTDTLSIASVNIGDITDTNTGGAGVGIETDTGGISGAVSIAGFDFGGTGSGAQDGFFTITDAGNAGDIGLGTVDTDGSMYVTVNVTGTAGDITSGDITNDSVGNVAVSASTIGDVTLGNVAILDGGSVNITATPMGDVVTGDLFFDGSGSLNITETTGAIGDVTTGNIEFDSGVSAASGLKINAATGVGDVLINSVDYYNPAFGVIQINANTGATTGTLGTITISNPGDNSFAYGTAHDTSSGPGNAWNNIEWGTHSFAAALSIGDINIAGGAEGIFVGSLVPNSAGATFTGVGTDGAPVLHTGGTGTIGTVTLAGESDGLKLVADDGIGDLNINAPPAAAQAVAAATDGNTLFSIATGITIDANNDIAFEDGNGTPGANIVGSMGIIHVNGDSTAPVALSGNVTGVAVGDITLDFGNMKLSVLAQGGTGALDRLALNDTSTSTIGNVTASSGSIIGPFFSSNFIADSGVGNISASGSITIGVVSANHIAFDGIPGTLAHPSVNHPLGMITAGGSILIWNYRNVEETGPAATTADLATEDAGDITAGNSIQIDHFALGGDINNIDVNRVDKTTDSAGNTGFVMLPDFTVNGNVGTIISGLLPAGVSRPQDEVTVDGVIRGDPTVISAGDATASLALNIMHAVRAVGAAAPAAPVVLVTQGDGVTVGSGTDYIVSLAGTWGGGVTAPSMNLTLSFDGDGTTDGLDNTVTINDLSGDTSAGNSVLAVATRANPTDANNLAAYEAGGLGAKVVSMSSIGLIDPLFNLGGFMDTYIPAGDKGRNSFLQILVEGNLFGSIGGPGNVLPTATAAVMLGSNAPILGNIGNLEIEAEWFNPTSPDTSSLRSAQIFVTSIGELSFGSLAHYKSPDGAYSYEAVGAASSPNNTSYTGVNATTPRDGFWHDLEDFSALAALTGEVNVPVPPSSSVTKTFVGPTGAFEFITFTNNDTDSIATFDITFNAGMISSIYLFGDSLGVQYNALNPATPATNSNTNIFYGVSHNGNVATIPHTAGHNAIDFLEFSSTIGNVTTVDVNPPDGIPASVGDIVVGYFVTENGEDNALDIMDYINNPNNELDPGLPVPDETVVTANGNIYYGRTGNINVDGSIHEIATSGGVGNVTTNDTLNELPSPFPSANLGGLVTDGSAGAITINGNVKHCLVVGDAVLTSLGTEGVIDPVPSATNTNVVGVEGDAAPIFGGNITVTGNLGTWAEWVPPETAFYAADTTTELTDGEVPSYSYAGDANVQAPSYEYAATYMDTAETVYNLGGVLFNLNNAYDHEQVSAPNGINVNITVGGSIETAIISGKEILVKQNENQSGDSITGSIIAGQTATTTTVGNNAITNPMGGVLYALVGGSPTDTGGNINSDIWSGDQIGNPDGGSVIEAFASTVPGHTILNSGTDLGVAYGVGGGIAGIFGWNGSLHVGGHNASVLVYATGGSAGNIYSNILADADIYSLHVVAGSGSGGSLLANIVAGLDPLYEANGFGGGGGGIVGEDNYIQADNDIGNPDSLGVGVNVVSSAGSQYWDYVQAGNEAYTTPSASGNINSDFFAGVPIGATAPRQVAINDTQLNTAGAAFFQDADNSIYIYDLEAGDTGNDSFGFFNSNLNGWLAAAGSITVDDLQIDGNATGDNGALGGHVAAAGLGYKEGSPLDQNELNIGGGEIVGTLYGTFSAGMFVPVGQSSAVPSPLNPNDLGPLVPGTILTTGQVNIGVADGGTLDVGAWDQSANSITLPALLAGTQTGVVSGYVPAFSVGATCGIDLDIYAEGLPFVSPQTGNGNVSDAPATGDIKNVSIVSFNDNGNANDGYGNGIGVGGSVTAQDGATFNMVLSNVDAITAIGSTDSFPSNPSAPSTLNPLNSGAAADNELDITTYGYGPNGGLNVAYDLAGFDYFNAAKTGIFWTSFGLGDVSGDLTAYNNDPNSATAGELQFALIAAGQNVTGDLYADNDIVARLGGSTTDGAPLFPNSSDADIVAGADANVGAALAILLGTPGGGNITGDIDAGGNITSTSATGLMDIAAIGNLENENGNITGDITSGERGPGNMNVFIIAGDSISGDIDAGDVYDYGENAVGNFTGGIWAGAGLDLQMNTTTDNSSNGSISGDIYVAGTLNATLGIYAQEDISGDIEVGAGINGGNLLGNVVAQGDISDIEVWGNLGASGATGLVFAGDNIDFLGVGNPVGTKNIAGHGDDVIAGTSTFGTVYDDVYIGDVSGSSTPDIEIGLGFAPSAMLLIGLDNGAGLNCSNLYLEQFGQALTFGNAGYSGSRMVVEVSGGTSNMPNILLYSNRSTPTAGEGPSVGLTVSGDGLMTGIGTLISLNALADLEVYNGSVGQIIVDNNYDIAGAINSLVGPDTVFGSLLDSVSWATASLPTVKDIEHAANTSKTPVDLDKVDVYGNIGIQGVSIGNGLTDLTTTGGAAIWVQGSITGTDDGYGGGSVTSTQGSIGNIVVGGMVEDADITAYVDVGDIYAALGGFGPAFGEGTITAQTGSMGVLSVKDGLDIGSETGPFSVSENIGGLIARNGRIGDFDNDNDGSLDVHGSIGVLQASADVEGIYTAQTGSVGVLNVNSFLSQNPVAGIYTETGNIEVTITANGGVQLDPYSLEYVNVVNGSVLDGVGTLYAALGNIDATITTGGSVGALASTVSEGGNPNQVIGGIAAPLGEVDVTLYVGGNVGGISGQSVYLDPDSVILGSIGLLRTAQTGSQEVGGVNSDNPLIIQTRDNNNNLVNYIVEVDSGSAIVDYTVNYDDTVSFDSITYSAVGSDAGIHVITRTGQRTAGGVDAMGPSSVQTEVHDLVVNGNVANIEVDGSLDNLTVNGNLAPGFDENSGTLWVEDKLGDAHITGNLGSFTSESNPFIAGDEAVQIGDAEFGCLTVDGTNYGLVHTSVGAGDWLTWANTLRTSNTVGDAFITVFLGSGKADLTINNGYLQEVDIARGTASNLVVLASDTAYAPLANGTASVQQDLKDDNSELIADKKTLATDTKNGALPSVIAADNAAISAIQDDIKSDNLVIRTNRPILSTQGSKIAQGTSTDEIFDIGPKTANVGIIAAENNAVLNLIGVDVEGEIEKISGQVGRSLIYNVVTAGDVDCIIGGTIMNLFVGGDLGDLTGRVISKVTVVGDVDSIQASLQASSLDLRGDAGLVDGGVNLLTVSVKGDADVIKASNYVGNVHVKGNAGIVSSGNLLTLITVGGSSLAVDAKVMSNVQIAGSVGFAVVDPPSGTSGSESWYNSNIVLGNAFCFDTAARLFGFNPENLDLAGSRGPSDTRYFGGIATGIASNVNVGGANSNLLIWQMTTGSASLFNNTQDNAIMYTPRGLFEKMDGKVTLVPPQKPPTTIKLDIQGLQGLFKSWTSGG